MNALSAATTYSDRKREYNNTWDRCNDVGIDYRPLVFEVFGGLAEEGQKVVDSLNRLVAENTHTPLTEVAQRFWTRMSIDLQRANHRAWDRRVRATGFSGRGITGRAMALSLLQGAPGEGGALS